MRAARLHELGGPFSIDRIEIPEPRGSDVLICVRSCGVVPNLRNVIKFLPQWHPDLPLPPLPAIFGLDPAGVVAAVGPDVREIDIGQRVYANPARSCGTCRSCRRAEFNHCSSYTFAGYFGFGMGSVDIFKRYPWGGFAEFMIAPAASLVFLPDSVSFEQAARFGYLGTAYAALRKARCTPASTVLINGATGTLGIGAVLLALAMGAAQILAVARNELLLERVRGIDPDRIKVFSANNGSTSEWSRAITRGRGVDVVLDTLGPGSPPSQSSEALMTVARGGRFVNIGGMRDPLPINPTHLMVSEVSYIGSNWFSAGEGEDMADLAASGALDLGYFEHRRYTLDALNEALDAAASSPQGGFSNVVVQP